MVLKIGHRGAKGYEPENTIPSFKKGIELGVDYVELDVHLSKDNYLIVIHDETLNRTTNGVGKISEKTLEEIKQYRTKNKNQQIPTLQEVIDAVKGKTKINIEIKGVGPAEEVAKTIKKNKLEKEVIVSSNYYQSLITVKKILPNVKTALIYYSAKTEIGECLFTVASLAFFPITKAIILKRARLAKVDYIHLIHNLATKNFVEKLHSLEYKVNVWTVNHIKTAKKLIEKKNIDGIISNYPDIL